MSRRDIGRSVSNRALFTASQQDIGLPVFVKATAGQVRTPNKEVNLSSDAEQVKLRVKDLCRIQNHLESGLPLPSLEKFAAILGDLPEAGEICKAGCDLYGVVIGYEIEGSYVLAAPSKPSQAQLQMGNLLATNFQGDETKDQWTVAIGLVLEKGGRDYGDRKPPDWTSKIVTVQIEVAMRAGHSMLLLGSTSESPVKIRTWTPEPR